MFMNVLSSPDKYQVQFKAEGKAKKKDHLQRSPIS